MFSQNNIQKLIDKVKKVEQGEKLDLSSGEDLSIGIMNLISIEEHLFFTYNKTRASKYLDLLEEIRKMRKELLKKLIKDYEGEIWCISKHLLAAAMRLIEVGTKTLSQGDKKSAEDLFQKAYQLYSLFWGINLKIVDLPSIRQTDADLNSVTITSDGRQPKARGTVSVFDKLGQLVQKVVDCCKE